MTIEYFLIRAFNDKTISVPVIAHGWMGWAKVDDVLACYFESYAESMKFYTTWKFKNKVNDRCGFDNAANESHRHGTFVSCHDFDKMVRDLEI